MPRVKFAQFTRRGRDNESIWGMSQVTEQPLDDGHAQNSALYEDLINRHGPLLSGRDLVRALGFRNAAALRQARLRGNIAVPTFSLPNRKGTFAMTQDVANWLGNMARPQRKEADM